jgi:hypothetical protein
MQHGWPALADGAALPEDITASAEWFFEMKSPFQNALKERRGEAVTRALTQKLQRRRSKCRDGHPRDVDPTCALHRALSAVEEVRLEMALRAAWAEEALTYAVSTQRAAAAERARLARRRAEWSARGAMLWSSGRVRCSDPRPANAQPARMLISEELERLCEGFRIGQSSR